ncbi:MAG: hypothetical protein ACPG5B_01160 [Chitinophagales bacterium]
MNTTFQAIIRFSIKFFVLYLLFLTLFSLTSLKKNNANFFRATNQSFFGSFVGDGITEFLPNPNEPLKDTKVVLKNERQINKIIQEAKRKGLSQIRLNSHIALLDSWIFVGLNIVFLLSLIWASPISWKQMAVATIGGLLFFEIFILFKTFIFLVYQFNFYPDLQVANLGSFGKSFIKNTYFISQSTIFNLIIVVFIWVAFCFDKKTWKQLA